MGIQTGLVLALVALAAAFFLRRLRPGARACPGCCEGCRASGNCSLERLQAAKKRLEDGRKAPR